MSRQRAQSIVIQNKKVLFGTGLISEGCYRHFFIGGGVEDDETPEEAAIRELKEEANVDGKILFKLDDGDFGNHHTFLADIGDQVPTLGFDPEIEEMMKDFSHRALQGLEFIDLDDFEKFTAIDFLYFEILHDECIRRNHQVEWINEIKNIIDKNIASVTGEVPASEAMESNVF